MCRCISEVETDGDVIGKSKNKTGFFVGIG